MSSSDESSDGGSYHESENDSSSDESSVQPTAGPGRSAEELIAAHRAGEYRVDLMREARWLRDSEGLGGLDGGLRDALFSDPRTGNPLTIPVHGAADAVDGIDAGYLARRLAWGTESGEAVVRIFVLDEHVVLFHSGHPAGAHVCAYDRALVDEAAKNSLFNVESRTPAVTPLATTVLRGSAQDQHPEEVAMTYLHDLSTDDDGFWRCDWIPFADGSYRIDRSEEVLGQEFQDLSSISDLSHETTETELHLIFLRAVVFRNRWKAYPPPGARKRQRNWDRRKIHVLLRARRAAGTVFGTFLYDAVPDALFRDILMCL